MEKDIFGLDEHKEIANAKFIGEIIECMVRCNYNLQYTTFYH